MGDGPFTVAQFVADLDALRQALGHVTWWVGGGPLEYSLQASAKNRRGQAAPGSRRAVRPLYAAIRAIMRSYTSWTSALSRHRRSWRPALLSLAWLDRCGWLRPD